MSSVMTTHDVRPALVLDLDGTVRYNKDDPEGFINNADQIAIFDDVAPIIKQYKDEGYLILGVSNQGGVAYGHKTARDADYELHVTERLLSRQLGGPCFDKLNCCLFMGGGKVFPFNYRSLRRKPHIGMLAVMEAELEAEGIIVNWQFSLVIGDREDDKLLAENAGVEFQHADEFFGREK
jgi:D-glycero-D-manno-heptose 1,7-bisphosphate phosphatase